MMKIITSGLGRKTTARMTITMMYGMDSPASTIRIRNESTGPPMNPENAPYRVPIRTATIAAATPTSSEVWPPTISRPNLVVAEVVAAEQVRSARRAQRRGQVGVHLIGVIDMRARRSRTAR